jgi:uncharacterized membrane protein YjjB (DUF3815 family)
MWNAALVFFGAMAIDGLWSFYIICSAKRQALRAAFIASVLALIGGFVLISFVSNHWTIVADAAGAFMGTYLSIKYSKKEET